MGADVARVDSPGPETDHATDAYLHAAKRQVPRNGGAYGDRGFLRDLVERAAVVVADAPFADRLPQARRRPLGAHRAQRRRAGTRGSKCPRPRAQVVGERGSTRPGPRRPRRAGPAAGLAGVLLRRSSGGNGRDRGAPSRAAYADTGARRRDARKVLADLVLNMPSDGDGAGGPGMRVDSRRSSLIEAADGAAFLNLGDVYAESFLSFALGNGLLDCDRDASDSERCASGIRALRAWPRSEIVERAQEWRLPAGAVLSVPELRQDEQIRHRASLRAARLPDGTEAEMPWLPWIESPVER